MSPKLETVLPLSEVTMMDGATAGHQSSRYRVLWGLQRQGALTACPPSSTSRPGPTQPSPRAHTHRPWVWDGSKRGTVTFWQTIPHLAPSTAPEAQGFRPLPVLDVTTGNDTRDHKLVKLPWE